MASSTDPSTAANAISFHSRVRVSGLKGAVELNGALARVVGPEASGRWPLKISGPANVVARHPHGVKVKAGGDCRCHWM